MINTEEKHSIIRVQNGHEVGEMTIHKPIGDTDQLKDAFILLGQFLGFNHKQVEDMFFDEHQQ